jgi:hypothetical protein
MMDEPSCNFQSQWDILMWHMTWNFNFSRPKQQTNGIRNEKNNWETHLERRHHPYSGFSEGLRLRQAAVAYAANEDLEKVGLYILIPGNRKPHAQTRRTIFLFFAS